MGRIASPKVLLPPLAEGYKPGFDFNAETPVARNLSLRAICFPVYSDVSESEMDEILTISEAAPGQGASAQRGVEMTTCVLLSWGNPDIAIGSLNSFLEDEPKLDIHLLENPDYNLDYQLENYAKQLIAEGKISRYVRFEDNISNNAFYLYLSSLDKLEIRVHDCFRL